MLYDVCILIWFLRVYFVRKVFQWDLHNLCKMTTSYKRAWTTRPQVWGKRGILALIELGSWDLYQILISFYNLGIWRVFCKFFIFEPVVHYCPFFRATSWWVFRKFFFSKILFSKFFSKIFLKLEANSINLKMINKIESLVKISAV